MCLKDLIDLRFCQANEIVLIHGVLMVFSVLPFFKQKMSHFKKVLKIAWLKHILRE